METEAISLAVVMQRLPLASRWQAYQWRAAEVTAAPLPTGAPRCLHDDEQDLRWLFTGFAVSLYSDEAEGYFLNLGSAQPCWFVMSRMETIDGLEVAVPRHLTLSYNEAARLMDAGEQVDTVAAEGPFIERMAVFVNAHYRPEVKHKRRKPSFEGGAAVARMAKEEGRGR
ncbi:MAG: DUF3305 domain-containing protein [Pseudomonadota bacterium]